jgi:hypothetical protein
MKAVNYDWQDYSLQSSDIIGKYQLSKENYDFPLFHHPPFFVYFSSFLHYYCSFPLPFISILYQLVVLLLFLPLSYLLLSNSMLKRSWLIIAWKCMIIWMICPIAAFCSQKFWIDNALVMTTMIGIILFLFFHKWILPGIPTNLFFLSSFICGLVSFVLPVNTKVTSVGLLPFMFIYHFWNISIEIKKRKKGTSSATTLYCCWSLLLGCVSSYLPWLSVYYLNTGRMLPSALPSNEMLEKYPFVRRAVMKPWYTYLLSITAISPLHCFGLCVFSALIVRFFFHKFVVPHILTGKVLAEKKVLSIFKSLTEIGLLPLSFLFFLTILGLLGGGYQTRFILPILPFSCFVTSLVMELLYSTKASNWCLCVSVLECFFLLSFVYSTALTFYYGTLFAISYADLEYSLIDIVFQILSSPFQAGMVNNDFYHLIGHYGIIRN